MLYEPGLSVPEIMKFLITEESSIMNFLSGGVVVGGADEKQQAGGVIEIADAGWQKINLYVPIIDQKLRILIIGPDTTVVDTVKNLFIQRFHYDNKAKQRIVVNQENGESYLVHGTSITTGPSQAPSELHAFFQERLYIAIKVGTEAIL